MVKARLLSFLFVAISTLGFAQSFTNLYEFPPVPGPSGWCDYDHDGDMDFATSDYRDEKYITYIYRNDAGKFVNTDITFETGGYNLWIDYESDGDDDLVIVDDLANTITIAQNVNGVFTP